MTDFAADSRPERDQEIRLKKDKILSVYLIPLALITVGGAVSVGWIACLGWVGGKLFSFW